jgi:hypothetical protein
MTKAVQLIAVCTHGCNNSGCEHILQEITLPTAESNGTRWMTAEIDYVKYTQHLSISTVAVALGRTYYATAHVRSKIKRGMLEV